MAIGLGEIVITAFITYGIVLSLVLAFVAKTPSPAVRTMRRRDISAPDVRGQREDTIYADLHRKRIYSDNDDEGTTTTTASET